MRIVLDLDTVDPLRFETAGLTDVRIARDGRPHDSTEPRAGRYALVVTGRAGAVTVCGRVAAAVSRRNPLSPLRVSCGTIQCGPVRDGPVPTPPARDR